MSPDERLPRLADEVDALMSLDELVDQASMDSFPASDPPTFWARDRDETNDHEDPI